MSRRADTENKADDEECNVRENIPIILAQQQSGKFSTIRNKAFFESGSLHSANVSCKNSRQVSKVVVMTKTPSSYKVGTPIDH
jgi:hypothetical protein